jgi:uncharacterized DUF497 family protein
LEIRFLCDADGSTHIHKHGVSEREAIRVFWGAKHRAPAKRGAKMALGQTDTGRFLKVIYKPIDRGILIITAYDLRGKELKAFRRLVRRRPT